MKRLIAVLILTFSAASARAHFIWLLPVDDRNAEEVRMVFSDTLAPDDNVPITKIAQTKLFGRAPNGDTFQVKMIEAKDAYRVTLAKDGLLLVAGTCNYGVIDKKGESFLLMYHPKTTQKKGFVKEAPAWLFKGTSDLPLEFVAVDGGKPVYKVLWQGKPAADVEVVLHVPGLDKAIERKTDANGQFELAEPRKGGIYGMRARFVERKEGELDGKKNREIRHYATFTFYVPQRLLDKK
jgi:uncharacterized GH25 family protein